VYGDRNSIPQLSYGSTLITFSDKNNYAFFTRTCPSDGVQASALKDLLVSLGLTNIAVISIADDPTSKTLADAFLAR
jgi:ABC-type branched-subunit amino acid transport system substrate-binding protein